MQLWTAESGLMFRNRCSQSFDDRYCVFDRVMAELPIFPDAKLDEPITVSHRLCKTKIECLRWCSAHEMIHAGQIGLLRRLFGQPPIW